MNTTVNDEHMVHAVTEQTVALDKRVMDFITRTITKHPLSSFNLVHDNRNLVIAAMVEIMFKHLPEGQRGLQEEIMHFLAGDEWLYSVSTMLKDGFLFTYPAPGRHGHITGLDGYKAVPMDQRAGNNQGFMVYRAGTTRHVGRIEGMQLAVANGQMRRVMGENKYQGHELFSEDLW